MINEHPPAPLAVPRLDTSVVGSRVLVFDEVDSTNERALKLGGDGTVVVAERQTAGRGRHGRSWASDPGLGLWLSVSFVGAEEGIAFMGPLALHDALRSICPVKLKWPNDVLVGGKKMAGILVERRGGHTVLGMGVNVNHEKSQFPADVQHLATSLSIETGAQYDRAVLLRDILSELDKLVMIGRSGGLESIRRAWTEACAIEGRRVRHGDIEGVVTSIDTTGALTVATADGEQRIVFGEIIELEEA